LGFILSAMCKTFLGGTPHAGTGAVRHDLVTGRQRGAAEAGS
jgi:hypothetical protein